MTPPKACAMLTTTPEDIARAADLINEGKLVAFPTETVYGLGGDACNDRAVASIFSVKGRPQFNPLIVHYADADSVLQDVTFSEQAHGLAKRFWPGPLTIILPRRSESRISLLASAGLDTIAVRIPAHDTARALIAQAQTPIAAPSANKSGHVSPTTAEHVIADLGNDIAAVIDGGNCPVGLESTVLDLSEGTPALLRPGKITQEELETIVGPVASAATGGNQQPRSPGMLERHYAPHHPLRMEAEKARAGEILLGFGPEAPADAPNLSPAGDLGEAAARLFILIRELDRRCTQSGPAGIAVMPVPETGIGRAINDRLRRAAHG